MEERFDAKIESNLLRTITKIFVEIDDCILPEEACNMNFGILDSSNACMIIPKTVRAKRILSRFKQKEKSDKIPELIFKNEQCVTNYSIIFFSRIVNILKCCSENITLGFNEEYPLICMNDDFKIILAPKVNNNEKLDQKSKSLWQIE